MLRLLLVPAVALLLLGGEGLYFAIAASHEVSTTCDRVAQASRWSPHIRITGCELDYAAAGYRQSAGGAIEELFVPARPPSARTTAAPIVVAIQDPAVIAAAQSAGGSDRSTMTDRLAESMPHLGQMLGAAKEIDGLARAGTIERFRTRRILSGFTTPIAPGAIVIDLRRQPDYVRPALALAAGALLAFIALRFDRRPGAKAIVPETVELSSSPPADEHRTLKPPPVALPGLLLLNLDVTSGPDAIETAPPLGSRSDVVEILCGVIPDLDVDDQKRRLARPDRSIALDLGAKDPIATVVVEARGEGGAALVKEILFMTGWRAFAPKMGHFLGADDFDAFGALAEPSSDAPATEG